MAHNNRKAKRGKQSKIGDGVMLARMAEAGIAPKIADGGRELCDCCGEMRRDVRLMPEVGSCDPDHRIGVCFLCRKEHEREIERERRIS